VFFESMFSSAQLPVVSGGAAGARLRGFRPFQNLDRQGASQTGSQPLTDVRGSEAEPAHLPNGAWICSPRLRPLLPQYAPRKGAILRANLKKIFNLRVEMAIEDHTHAGCLKAARVSKPYTRFWKGFSFNV
jgi:hypothetical protein